MIRDSHRRSLALVADEGRSLIDADHALIASIDRRFAVSAERAGAWLVCKPGCDACCHGPFPITELDRRRLARGLEELTRRDPTRAADLRDRARVAIDQFSPDFPGDISTGWLTSEPQRIDAFRERHRVAPCPALDPESGRCDLYDARPIVCRVHGAPLRFGEVQCPPCGLCFQAASPAEIDASRFDPDPEDREGALLGELAATGSEHGETLVAWALARIE